MSIEVRIPKEITEYKEKIILGLSFRQLAAGAVCIVSAIGANYLGSCIFNDTVGKFLSMIIPAPVFAVGFIKKNGFTMEKYISMVFKHVFRVNRRPYKTELIFDEKIYDKKEGENNAESVKKRKHKKSRNIVKEYAYDEISKKGFKGQIKAARKSIKEAVKEYEAAKQAV